MSDIVHVIRATVDPSAAPTRAGQHWVNEATKKTWLAVGTATVSDWVLFTDAQTVKASTNDTTAGFLSSKLSAGSGITLTTINPGANETIQIAAPGSTTDEQVKVSASDTTAGYLFGKLVVDNGTNAVNPLESAILSAGGDEDFRIRLDQTKLSLTASQTTDFNEAAQDAVGGILTDTTTIDFTYNDTSNQITADLKNTTVIAASYGSATQVGTFTVDAQGRLTAASNTSIAIPSTQITDFTEAVQDAMGGTLVDSTSVDFVYNDIANTQTANVIPGGVNHDALQNWVANKHIDHSSVSLIAGTGISATGLGDITASRTIGLANTSVTASSYGSASQVPTFTVNAQGQLTAASNVSIAIPSTSVTDFAEAVDDRVAALLVAGSGISLTYNDPANTLTVASNITQYTDEQAQDATAALIQNGTGISWTYSDIANTLTPAVSLAPFSTTNLAEGTNLYFTNSRAQAAITVSDTASLDLTYLAGNISGAVLPAGVNHNLLQNYVANEHINHASVSISAGTGLTGGGDITASRTLSLANTTVTAGSYGSSSSVATFTVDAQGRLTAAGSTAISIPSTQITDFTEAVQDVMGGALVDSSSVDFIYNDISNTQTANVIPGGVNHDALQNWVANKHIDHSTVSISAGTGLTGGGDITTSRTLSIANTGVTAGTYGSSTLIPVITVNAQGQLTVVSTVSGYSPWSVKTDIDAGGLLTWEDQTGQDLCIRQAGSSGSAYIRQVSSNGTLAAPTATTSGQRLGGNGMYGWNSGGVDSLPSGAMNVYATQNHTPTAQGGEMRIELIPDNTTTPVTTAVFTNRGDLDLSGCIQIGNTTDTTNGNLRFTGTEFQARESGVWKPVSQTPSYLSSAAAVNSTSTSFATLSLSSTPAAGSYKLEFTASAQISGATSVGEWAVFVGGVQQTITNRRMSSVSTTTIQGSVAIATIITVNGSQTVDVQFRRVSGTGTVTTTERELLLTAYAR
jgi:hypothetical protein